jgi:DnaD/phage-associated family protein
MDGEFATLQEIGERFQLTESDVIKAWRHWEKEKLVSITSDKKGQDMEILFLPVKSKKTPETSPVSAFDDLVQSDKVTLHESRPQYTAQELACYRSQCAEVEQLFTRAEKSLGKLLSYNDMNVIFGFHDWLRLPIEVIEYLLTYCAENDHRNLRYIEKCAFDWADRGISDLEEALSYVQSFGKTYRTIMSHLGRTGYPTEAERKYMDKWLNDWKMPQEIVLEACNRAAIETDKRRFNYTDGILKNWHSKNVQTLEDITAADDEHKKKPKVLMHPATAKTNRFANFKQRDIDFDKYEKLERAYLEKKYNL